jgi:hypothetical protein
VGQVVFVEFGQCMPGELVGVFGGAGEEDLVAGVGGEGQDGLAGELGQVLVRQHEGEPVAAGLGEHVADGPGEVEDVVGFVDDDGRVPAPVFGQAGAGGGGLPHRRQDEGGHQPGGVLAELSFGEAGDQDPAVEHCAHVERGGGGAEGGADEVA